MKLCKIAMVLLIFSVSGCVATPSNYQLTVDDYVAVSPKISLGMIKSDVIKILQPSQSRLKNTEIKQPDMYEKEGVFVEILYFRSGWQADGLTTDDEFTPYLFNDGKLAAIGWVTLGGPKTHGQAAPETNVNTTTIIRPYPFIF